MAKNTLIAQTIFTPRIARRLLHSLRKWTHHD
jgi:hypothetical protein